MYRPSQKKSQISLPPINTGITPTNKPLNDSSSRMEILTDPSILFPFKYPSFKLNNSLSAPLYLPTKLLSPKGRSSVETVQNRSLFSLKSQSTEESDPIDEYVKSELADENSLRQAQIINVMKDFNKLRIDYSETNPPQLKKQQMNLRENLIHLAERVLSLFNITYQYLNFPKIDSVFKLDIMNDRQSLSLLYRAVIPEMCKFPYSFFKRLGLLNITFGDNYVVYKPAEISVALKRLYRGVFPIGRLTTKEERILHFYKIILYLMKLRYKEFDQEWIRITPKPKINQSVIGFRPPEKPRNLFHEQVEAFRAFMQDPEEFLFSIIEFRKLQGIRFKELMEYIDPVGINSLWWKEVVVYSKIEEEVFNTKSTSKDEK